MQIQPQNGQIDPRLSHVARLLPHQINRVRLSKTQYRVLQAIKRGEQVTPKQIAERCGLSDSFASTTLKRLWEKSYLNRNCESDLTGGVVYLYSC
ncbi:MarR family winged helix-turn-helix transcriptional regulator [Grimontia hollisae]|uniref:MarR family winged helix-turn-helix transcriptional regulator n=1 Tax=Grimontia hollisae TaxID=673 RepID=UPI0013039306|nr:helix-turn-helix domain-containing protein [Grimontia hollisae]